MADSKLAADSAQFPTTPARPEKLEIVELKRFPEPTPRSYRLVWWAIGLSLLAVAIMIGGIWWHRGLVQQQAVEALQMHFSADVAYGSQRRGPPHGGIAPPDDSWSQFIGADFSHGVTGVTLSANGSDEALPHLKQLSSLKRVWIRPWGHFYYLDGGRSVRKSLERLRRELPGVNITELE